MDDLDQLFNLANPDDVAPALPQPEPEVTAPRAAPAAPVATPDDLDSMFGAANPEPVAPAPVAPVAPVAPEDPYAAKPDDKFVQGGAKSVLRTLRKYVDPYTDTTDTTALVEHGVGGLISMAGSASQYLNQPLWGDAQTPDPTTYAAKAKEWGNGFAAAAEKDLSPATAKLLNTPMSDTSWGNTIDAMVVKSVEAVPSIVASLYGGAGGWLLRGRAAAEGISFAGSAGVGGILSAGQTYQDIADGINQTSSDVLAKNSPSYAANLAGGMKEADAKARLIRDVGWAQPLIAAAITGVTSKFGVEQMVASKAAGKVFGGIINGKLGPLLTGMTGEGLQEFIENSTQELLTQDAALRAKNGGKPPSALEYDWGRIGSAGREGAQIGAVMGGVIGHSLHTSPKTQSDTAPPQGPPAGPNGVGQNQDNPAGGLNPNASPPVEDPVEEEKKTRAAPADPEDGVDDYDDDYDDEVEEAPVDVEPQNEIDPDRAVVLNPPADEAQATPATALPEDPNAQVLRERALARKAAAPAAVINDQDVSAAMTAHAGAAPAMASTPVVGGGLKTMEDIVQAVQSIQQPAAPQVAPPNVPAAAPVPLEAQPATVDAANPPPAEPLGPPAGEAIQTGEAQSTTSSPEALATVEAAPTEAPPALAAPAAAPEAAAVTPGVTEEPSLDQVFEAAQGEAAPLTAIKGTLSVPKPKGVLKAKEIGQKVKASKPTPQEKTVYTSPMSDSNRNIAEPILRRELHDKIANEIEKGPKHLSEEQETALEKMKEGTAPQRKAYHQFKKEQLLAKQDRARAERAVKQALDEAFAEHAAESQSSQHGGAASAAAKALRVPIEKHARANVGRIMAEHETEAEIEETTKKVEEAEKTFEGQEKAAEVDKLRRKGQGPGGSGQTKARTGKTKGKTAEELRNEDERSFQRRHEKIVAEQGENAPELSKKAVTAFRELGALKGGKGIRRERARAGWQMDIDEARAAEYADADAAAAPQPTAEEKAAARTKALEAAKAAAIKSEEDRQAAIEAAKHPIDTVKEAAHKAILEDAVASTPEPNVTGMMPRAQLDAYGRHLVSIFEKIRQGVTGGALTTPGMSQKKTIVENMLARARPYLRPGITLGDQTELRVLLAEAQAATDPRQFFKDQQQEIKTAHENQVTEGSFAQNSDESEDWGYQLSIAPDDLDSFFAAETDAQHAIISKAGAIEATQTGLKTRHGEIAIGPERIRPLRKMLAQTKSSRPIAGYEFVTQADQIADAAEQQLNDNLGDVPVYTLTQAELDSLIPEHLKGRAAGLWIEPTQEQRAKGAKGGIVMADRGPMSNSMTLRHEGTHGLTVYAVDENINGTADILQSMLDHLKTVAPEMFTPGHPDWQYGTTSPKEFIAEAYGNPFFAEKLAAIPLPKRISNRIAGPTRRASFWDAFVSLVTRILRIDHFGRPAETYAEAVIRMQDGTLSDQAAVQRHAVLGVEQYPTAAAMPRSFVSVRSPGQTTYTSPGAEHLLTPNVIARSTVRAAGEVSRRADLPGVGVKAKRTAMKLRTNTKLAVSIRDVLDRAGKTENALEDVNDAMREQEPFAKTFQNKGDKIISRLHTLPEGRANAVNDLVTDATVWGIDPANPNFGKKAGTNSHISKAGSRHRKHRRAGDKLHAEFLKLPAEDQKLINEVREFYKDAQLILANETVDSIIGSYRANTKMPAMPAGVTDEALRDWIVDGGIDRVERGAQTQKTIDDEKDPVEKARMQAEFNHDKVLRAALGDELSAVMIKAKAIRGVKGFYSPLIRRGQFVVRARSKIAPDPNALISADGRKLIFDGPDALKNYEAWTDTNGDTMQFNPKFQWVDPLTQAKANAKDAGAERLITVTPHTDVFELYDKKADADARREILAKDPQHYDVKRVDTKDRTAFLNGKMLPSVQQSVIEEAVKHMPASTAATTRSAMVNAFMQNNARSTMSQRRLRRSGVPGYSKSVARGMSDYNISLSHNIARLRARPKLAGAFAKAEQFVKDLSDEAVTPNNTTDDLIKYRAALDRMKENINAFDAFDPTATSNRVVNAVMTMSFIKNLWSPATWFINGLQPVMVTLPKLAGKYGPRAVREFVRAYYHGGFGVEQVTNAVKNVGRSFRGRPKVSGAELLLNRIKDPQELAMLREHQRLGLISANAGLEVTAQNVDHNMFEKGLSWAASFSSQMMEAIENMNRFVTALTTYRLARTAKNEDGSTYTHEQAVKESLDVQNDTQGDYSGAVQPAFMQKKGFQAVFQFKKYPQMIMDNFASVGKQALKGKTKAERKAARKELAYLSATHFMAAGAVGLPMMEFAKVFYIIAAGLGLSDDDWDDKENKFQAWLKTIMGDRASEAVMRGLPRLLGADLSARMGLDNLVTFGSPKTYDTPGFSTWAWEMSTGAPASAMTDLFKGLRELYDGEYLKALGETPLPKVIADALQVGRQYQQGGITKSTGRLIPGTAPETMDSIMKVLGFQPASRSRAFETGGDVFEKKQKDKADKVRTDQMGTWLNATTGAERKAAWDKIREWNKGIAEWNRAHPKDRRKVITMGDLTRNKAKRAKEDKKTLKQREDRQLEEQ